MSRKQSVFEHRKWVGLTSYCNNRCIFCLDGDLKDKKNKTLAEIRKELQEGIKEGCTRLVLSGGEATIHPDFIKVVQLGKKLGYTRVQVISNGRMFSYKNFVNDAVKGGLDEITFSIHGHTKDLQDKLTGIDGTFEQVVKGIKNALKQNIIVNVDIVLNKMNVEHFPEIIQFLLNLGIMEFDVLQITPFGRASNGSLFYDIKENMPAIRKGLDTALKAGAVVWTNRFPPQYLEGYEELMQDPIKLLDEIRGREKEYEENEHLSCYGKACSLCYLKELCKFIVDTRKEGASTEKEVSPSTLFITKQNYKELDNHAKQIFSLIPPHHNYKDYETVAPNIKRILPYLYKAADNISSPVIQNVPYCFLEEKYWKYVNNEPSHFDDNVNLDVMKMTQYYIGHKKIKAEKCSKCKFDKKCPGVFQKYISIFGFKQLKPVLRKRP